MKLINIKICGIRGFNLEKEINFDEGLTVIYGPNGEGKTSFVEAIEWLIFGTMFKKEKALSKNEFKETIKNIHFLDETPYVEAVFRKDGALIKARREYVDEKNSKLFVNGNPAKSIVGEEFNDAIKPIIYQHGLKSFIHSAPKDRYIEFMKFLNIDDLDTFIKQIDKSQKNYQNSKNDGILKSIRFCENIKKELPEYYRSIVENDLEIIDLANLINKELKVTEENITIQNFEIFKQSIHAMIERTKKNVFDVGVFSPILTFEPLVCEDIHDVSELRDSIKYLEDPNINHSINKIDVLDSGLKVIQESSLIECPLCFEKTINENKIESIKRKLAEYNKFKTELKIHETHIKTYVAKFNQFYRGPLSALNQLRLDEEIIPSLRMMKIEPELIQGVADFNRKIDRKIIFIEEKIELTNQYMSRISETPSIETLQKHEMELNQIKRSIFDVDGIVELYSPVIQQVKELLVVKITNSEQVNKLEEISSLLVNLKHFKVIQLDQKIQIQLKNALIQLKTFRNMKLDQMISSSKIDIIKWYDLLNPNEDIRISDIESDKDKINFIATSYGVKKQAVPILSEAHLNCLGLSIYLSYITQANNSFAFIFIDDPVQSMDSVHTDNFINSVIDELYKKDIQILLFSHLKTTVTDLILRRYKAYLPTFIEFYGYNLEGPQIAIKNSNNFEEYLSQAEQNYNGLVEQRKMASNMIRQALETFAKEYYIKKSGEDLPNTYKDATFTVLDDKLLSRVGIDQAERGKMRVINAKCDKRSHDDQKFEPPTSQELRSHIDILKGLHKKHIKGI